MKEGDPVFHPKYNPGVIKELYGSMAYVREQPRKDERIGFTCPVTELESTELCVRRHPMKPVSIAGTTVGYFCPTCKERYTVETEYVDEV